jgi:hypothetical protein
MVVSILTTAGATFFTMGAKLPAGGVFRDREVSSKGMFKAGPSLFASSEDILVKASVEPATARTLARTRTGSRFRTLSFIFIFNSMLFIGFLYPLG